MDGWQLGDNGGSTGGSSLSEDARSKRSSTVSRYEGTHDALGSMLFQARSAILRWHRAPCKQRGQMETHLDSPARPALDASAAVAVFVGAEPLQSKQEWCSHRPRTEAILPVMQETQPAEDPVAIGHILILSFRLHLPGRTSRAHQAWKPKIAKGAKEQSKEVPRYRKGQGSV